MKHEMIELHDVQIIGMAKKIAFNEAKDEYIKVATCLKACSFSPFKAEMLMVATSGTAVVI